MPPAVPLPSFPSVDLTIPSSADWVVQVSVSRHRLLVLRGLVSHGKRFKALLPLLLQLVKLLQILLCGNSGLVLLLLLLLR